MGPWLSLSVSGRVSLWKKEKVGSRTGSFTSIINNQSNSVKKQSIFLQTTLCLVLSISISASIAQKVTVDFDSQADFKKFKTYAWLAPGDSVLNRYRADKLFGGTILYFANQEIKSRGLIMDTLKPDAIFVFGTNVNEITKYSQSATLSVGIGVGVPGYYVGGGY
jgi:hypothetical protein